MDGVAPHDVAAPHVVGQDHGVVLGAAALGEVPGPVEDRRVPDLVVLDPVPVAALDPDTGRLDLVDPRRAHHAVGRVAQVDALAVAVRAVVADLQVLDAHVRDPVEVEAVLLAGHVHRVAGRAAVVGEAHAQGRAVEEEAPRRPGPQGLERGQRVVAIEPSGLGHHVVRGEAGDPRVDATPGRRPAHAPSGDGRVGPVQDRPGHAPEDDRLGGRPRRGHAHALAVDARLDRDQVAGLGEVGRVLDRPQRRRRVGAGVGVVAGGGDVERAQRRLRQRVGPGHEGRDRRRARDAVGVGQRHAHLVGRPGAQPEQAAHEVRGVDAHQRVGVGPGPAGRPPLERGRGVRVGVAGDERDHPPGLEVPVGREGRERDRVLGQRGRAGRQQQAGQEGEAGHGALPHGGRPNGQGCRVPRS